MSTLTISDHVNPAMLQLVKLLCKIVFAAHLIACFWFYMNDCSPFIDIEPLDKNWVEENNPDDAVETYPACQSRYGNSCWVKCGKAELGSRYLASMYWTIATMMAVGYGDIYATTPAERMYAIFTQLLGALSFGMIIATVTVIIETVDPVATAKREILEEMMRYAYERQLNTKLQRRIRRHLTYAFGNRSVLKESQLLGNLSDHLRLKVVFHTRTQLLNVLVLPTKVDIRMVMTMTENLQPMRLSLIHI